MHMGATLFLLRLLWVPNCSVFENLDSYSWKKVKKLEMNRWGSVISLQTRHAESKNKAQKLSGVALQVPTSKFALCQSLFILSPRRRGELSPVYYSNRLCGNYRKHYLKRRVNKSCPTIHWTLSSLLRPPPSLLSVTPFICAIYAVTGSVCPPVILPLNFPISPASSSDAVHLSGNAAISFLGSS